MVRHVTQAMLGIEENFSEASEPEMKIEAEPLEGRESGTKCIDPFPPVGYRGRDLY